MKTLLLKQYNELVKQYGVNKIENFFKSGFESFKNSRTVGNYSFDAVKQTFKIMYNEN